MRTLLPALLSLALSACATMQCAPGETRTQQELVYFGTQTPKGEVTREQWKAFLAEVVTPRFPQGFSTWQANGQWRMATGEIVHEPSYVVSFVHAGEGAAVAEIVESYKRAYQQEAVLRVRSSACVSF